LALEWDLDLQRGAAAGGACDFECAAERVDSVAEADESGPLGGVGAADPVVADRQLHVPVVCVELDVDDGCVRVLGGVGQRL
jgi:hypothetical protein